MAKTITQTEQLLAPKAAATGKLTILKSLSKPADQSKDKQKSKKSKK